MAIGCPHNAGPAEAANRAHRDAIHTLGSGENFSGVCRVGLAVEDPTSLAASDLTRAQAWYAEKLSLEPLHVYDDELLVYRQGATHLSIYATPSAGTAKNTVAVWRVDDLRAEMAAMRARGVVFGDYDMGDTGTVEGVYTDPDDGTLAAWFMDSEDNTLGLVEDHGEPVRPQ